MLRERKVHLLALHSFISCVKYSQQNLNLSKLILYQNETETNISK